MLPSLLPLSCSLLRATPLTFCFSASTCEAYFLMAASSPSRGISMPCMLPQVSTGSAVGLDDRKAVALASMPAMKSRYDFWDSLKVSSTRSSSAGQGCLSSGRLQPLPRGRAPRSLRFAQAA